MKKILIKIAILTGIIAISTGVAAAISGGDTYFTQRDPTNSFQQITFLPLPTSPSVITMDSSTNLPVYTSFGSGISFNNINDTLSVANVSESSITNLTTDLASKFNTPTGSSSQVVLGDGTLGALPAVSSLSFNNAASHSIVTTAAAANGFQISAINNTSVFYSVNINTTATIGSSSDGYIILEIAATNSTTASDWKEVSRSRNGQNITLAALLSSVQNIGGELMNIVPAGYYARLRSVNVSGTPGYSYISGQEVQL